MKYFILPFLLFSLTSTLFATTIDSGLLVKLKANTKMPESSFAIKRTKNLFDRVFYILPEHKADLKFLREELIRTDKFEYVDYNYRAPKRKMFEKGAMDLNLLMPFMVSPFNDPKASQVWSFNDAAQNGISINQSYTNRSRDRMPKQEILVAVVDTGIDVNHEDLKEVIWTNKKEIADNGIDDDNNGYIDDIHGINTIDRDQEGRPTNVLTDTAGHGTHVSGTIGAKQNNRIGIAGIASNVKIMAVRTVPDSGDETDVNVVEAFIYAAKNGAKIINCSFGKQVNEGGNAVLDAINFIGKQYGVLVVAAAGNESSNIDTRLTYPASYETPYLLVVAATVSSGGLAYFSNYGKKNVDLAAPGSNILSTVPGNRYASYSGTSMACPTTVGVAAEVLSVEPNLGPLELKSRLMGTVTPVQRFISQMQSGGRVDLYKALNASLF
ncbi:MAG: S8 family peptidase [Bacteriovoracaceae bacterium]